MAEYTKERLQEFGKQIMAATKPGQQIGKIALAGLVVLTPDQLTSGLRHLRIEGLVTQKLRRGHKGGSLYTMHSGPLPMDKRDVKPTATKVATNGCTLSQNVVELQRLERQVATLRATIAKQLGL